MTFRKVVLYFTRYFIGRNDVLLPTISDSQVIDYAFI